MNYKSYTRMTADVYDAIYTNKNYEAETGILKDLIAEHKKSSENELLDVACGTGLHLPFLVDDFAVTGVDLSEQQLEKARQRLPDVSFTQGDMRNFNLHRQFDVVTCLFSSIGYVHPYEELQTAVINMAKHLKPGGVLVIEPWLQPGVFDPDRPPHTQVSELPEKQLRVTRTTHNALEGNTSVMNMHHTVESPEGTREFTEEHRLALYSPEEYVYAFKAAGVSFERDEQGLSGRGLYIGVKLLADNAA
jgi:SAM-dependent methyltransferase